METIRVTEWNRERDEMSDGYPTRLERLRGRLAVLSERIRDGGAVISGFDCLPIPLGICLVPHTGKHMPGPWRERFVARVTGMLDYIPHDDLPPVPAASITDGIDALTDVIVTDQSTDPGLAAEAGYGDIPVLAPHYMYRIYDRARSCGVAPGFLFHLHALGYRGFRDLCMDVLSWYDGMLDPDSAMDGLDRWHGERAFCGRSRIGRQTDE